MCCHFTFMITNHNGGVYLYHKCIIRCNKYISRTVIYNENKWCKNKLQHKHDKGTTMIRLILYIYICILSHTINSLWPSDIIWRQGSTSTLAPVTACCLMAPSHYLNQCWLVISNVLLIVSRFFLALSLPVRFHQSMVNSDMILYSVKEKINHVLMNALYRLKTLNNRYMSKDFFFLNGVHFLFRLE